MNVKKMTKAQVMAHIRKTGTWNGYLMPCKMYSFDHFGFYVELMHTNNDCIVTLPNGQSFDDMYNAWAYYNATNETGLYAHYYMVV